MPGNKGIKVTREIEVQRPPSELFYYWKDLSNIPKFMPHVLSVEKTSEKGSHWVVEGPGGTQLEWDAEIINEHPGEMIAWRSLPGADVESAEPCALNLAMADRPRISGVTLQYHPPAGGWVRLLRASWENLGGAARPRSGGLPGVDGERR